MGLTALLAREVLLLASFQGPGTKVYRLSISNNEHSFFEKKFLVHCFL